MSYKDFFHTTCGFYPFPFQVRFQEVESDLKILMVPTGLGKTETVIADWLHDLPTKRLIYCLPGRALTRQTTERARKLVENIDKPVHVIELMGGSDDLDYRFGPDEPAILVGTQDILVSRALNRGYAQSPFRWPIDFGLLNNDATWVFDEVQLLGEAVATGAQLAAFRKRMGTFGKVRSVWMSATFDPSWLNTVDFREQPVIVRLGEEDLQIAEVAKRVHATKTVQETTECDSPRECAAFIRAQHRDDQLTVMIANTVARAQEIWSGLKDTGAILLHSRFRPHDRAGTVEQALKSDRGIIVSTQVIEAGVDLDAHLMITDAAPWASLVQRFGRVNRRGNHNGRIYWVRNPQGQRGSRKTDGLPYKPYEAEEVSKAIAVLESLTSAAPGDLPHVPAPAPYRYVLRRRDLLDLYDTTPDLANNHIDVSRFVRSGDETNIYVAWRSWPEKESPRPHGFSADELCPVPHLPGGSKEVRELLKRSGGGWVWNYANRGHWEKIGWQDPIYAGMRLLVRAEAGGYEKERGWTPDSKQVVQDLKTLLGVENSTNADPESETITETLEEHTDEVARELSTILGALTVELNGARAHLEQAARFHDWGKAHPVFQQTLHDLPKPPEEAPTPLLAKQKPKLSRRTHSRNSFRHELASALAMHCLQMPFLATYLVAAHHGKIRVNIRSMPGEANRPGVRIARGVEDGDTLFPADLGGNIAVPETALSLDITELGQGWAGEVGKLLLDYGPFRLAYLECLLRIADERASEKAKERRC